MPQNKVDKSCRKFSQTFLSAWARRPRICIARRNFTKCVSPTSFHECGQIFLKYNQTKYVMLRKNADDEMKLVVEDRSEGSVRGEGNVHIWKCKTYIKLVIEYTKDDLYLVTVDETGLQCRPTTKDSSDVQRHKTWFAKSPGIGTGQFCLYTVDPQDPESTHNRKYLVVDEQNWSITLRDQRTGVSSSLVTGSSPCQHNIPGCTGC